MTARTRAAPSEQPARERILDAACDVIAESGMDDVRIARIATLAGVSPALVHYHFATREALLAEALQHSFDLVGDVRMVGGAAAGWTAAERLGWMVDACLPYWGMAERDWKLWVELWLRAARLPDLRPVAARLYERYHAWFAEAIAEGIGAGEFADVEIDAVVGRLIGLIDGLGLRALLEDPAMDLERARREIVAALARDLGVPEGALAAPEAPGP
jgi:AcrR family transcriptional regulator